MLFVILISSGLFLGWSLGANDAANVFGSAVGSKMLSFRKAAIFASIFVILGAVFQGKGASDTLSSLGSVDALAGSFTVALCAAVTVYLMTRRSLPVSTSQAIVGAIIGWSAFTGNHTDLGVLSRIMMTWVTGPVLGIIFSALLYMLIRWVLKKRKLHVIKLDAYIRLGLILAGSFGSYSLGANNIANVMGVFVHSAPDVVINFGLFTLDGVQLLFGLGGITIALGIITYSQRVMNTVGNGILALTPEAAIVVVLSQALVLFIFSSTSLSNLLLSAGLPAIPLVPVSSTHVVIGSVLGIGLIKGAREIKYKALGGVVLGWITTPVAAGILTYFTLFFVQNLFQLPVTSQNPVSAPNLITESHTPAVSRVIDLVVPSGLAMASLFIILLLFLFFRQQRLRLKAENELLVQQNQLYVAQKALNDMEVLSIQKEKESLNAKLELKRREYNKIALSITGQKAFLQEVSVRTDEIIKTNDLKTREDKLQALSLMIRQKMSFSDEVDDYFGQIEHIHKDFFIKLETAFPNLTDQERRMAALLRMNLSIKEIATMLNITTKSVEIARYRLRKKLGLKRGVNLNHFINNL